MAKVDLSRALTGQGPESDQWLDHGGRPRRDGAAPDGTGSVEDGAEGGGHGGEVSRSDMNEDGVFLSLPPYLQQSPVLTNPGLHSLSRSFRGSGGMFPTRKSSLACIWIGKHRVA